MLRAIREIQPTWVVGENVFGIVNWNGGLVFNEVQADLEAEGYEVQPYVLPAAAVNAPHRRDRVWFVAHSKINRQPSTKRINKRRECVKDNRSKIWFTPNTNGSSKNASDTNCVRLEQCENRTEMGRGQKEMDRKRCKSTNAIEANGKISNASDTESERRRILRNEEQEARTQKSNELFRCKHSAQNWGKFPTKPPLCGGNDGIPRELDAITFSKWRNESIKAYGNAIVPQVALQIFKAIKMYENQK